VQPRRRNKISKIGIGTPSNQRITQPTLPERQLLKTVRMMVAPKRRVSIREVRTTEMFGNAWEQLHVPCHCENRQKRPQFSCELFAAQQKARTDWTMPIQCGLLLRPVAKMAVRD
jgi:hypothetical protein